MNTVAGLFFSVFLAICFTACASILPPSSEAATPVDTWMWAPVTTYNDATPITDPVYYRVYCDANPPVEAGMGVLEILIINALPANAADGKHSCAITAHLNKPCPDMVTGICEGDPSNSVTVVKRGDLFFSNGIPGKGQLRVK